MLSSNCSTDLTSQFQSDWHLCEIYPIKDSEKKKKSYRRVKSCTKNQIQPLKYFLHGLWQPLHSHTLNFKTIFSFFLLFKQPYTHTTQFEVEKLYWLCMIFPSLNNMPSNKYKGKCRLCLWYLFFTYHYSLLIKNMYWISL